jgi:5'-methylthioadenosine phosphorylase
MIPLAIIGGAEAQHILRHPEVHATDNGRMPTPFGESAHIFTVNTAAPFYFLCRHGHKQYTTNSSAVNYRANLYALKELGIECIVSWTGCGSITEGFPIGSIAALEDIIDETRNRTRTFFPQSGIGFLRQNPLFCPALKDCLCQAISKQNLRIRHGGVYVCTEGPRLDTVAEIRKYQTYGAELIGNSLAPEVFLARELELCYAAFAIVMNRAEGTVSRGYSPSEPFGGMVDNRERQKLDTLFSRVPNILNELSKTINDISASKRQNCACHHFLDHNRQNGLLDPDWHVNVTRESIQHS